MQAPDLFFAQISGERNRRKLRAVQDLVGVGVADAGKQTRIGEGTFQGVIFAFQSRTEIVEA